MNVTKLALAIPAAVVSLSLALTGCTHASEESASDGGSDASDNAKIIDAMDKDEDIAKLVPAKIANRGTLSSGMAAESRARTRSTGWPASLPSRSSPSFRW